MRVIFKVSGNPIIAITTDAQNTKLAEVNIYNPLLAEIAFPKVVDHPTIADLVVILRSYADLEGQNVNLDQIVAATGGSIPYIEFRQNLSVEFG
jgi:hypothetical protein